MFSARFPSLATVTLATLGILLPTVQQMQAQTNVVIGGGVKGQPVIANPTANAVSSPVWIDASAFSGADGCAILNAAMTASTNGNAVHGEGITSDQACATNPFPSTFTGSLYLGAAIYHLRTASSSWVVPGKVIVSGMGRSTVTASNNIGTTLQACQSSDPTCGVVFPSSTPLICFVNCNPAAAAQFGFDAQVWQMTFDCNQIPGCIAAANYWVQENSGYFSDEMTRWNNNGVGLDLCGGNGGVATPNCQNSSVLAVSVVAWTGLWPRRTYRVFNYDTRIDLSNALHGIPPAAVIAGKPTLGRPFLMAMEQSDSIGSIYQCTDRVEAAGGGICEIEPHSIHAGKHMRIERRYADVKLSVRRY